MFSTSDLGRAVLPWLSPTVRSWLPRTASGAESTAPVETWLADEVDRINNREFAEQLDALIPLDVSEPLLWANHILDLDTGESIHLRGDSTLPPRWALAGSRARDRDLDRGFVDIIATSSAPSLSTVDALARTLPLFSEFSPRCVRIYVPEPLSFADAITRSPSPTTAHVDTLLVAGRPQQGESVELMPLSPSLAVAVVEKVYAEITRTNPDLAWWARPADEEALSECAEAGLLFGIPAGTGRSEVVGVIAARPSDCFGIQGWEVVEKCVAPSSQGRGLGALANNALSGHLDLRGAGSREDGRGQKVLWGTIDPANVPSLRTAQRAGRDVVGGFLWVTPEGFPGMP